MSTKAKTKSDAEFIEKIKSISFNTGPKGGDICHNCGEPESNHIPSVAIPIPVAVASAAIAVAEQFKRRRAAQKATSEEAAFAA